MIIAFRTDASLEIGTGHVMRCLTLANHLRARDHRCLFLCRELPGHLIDYVRNQGHPVFTLPAATRSVMTPQASGPAHAHWLTVSQAEDARACREIILAEKPDLLVIDHYAITAEWEAELKPLVSGIAVIDDLVDRPHECDLLLDQTLGRMPGEYHSLVPAGCHLLCGAQYALLRPEFAEYRERSLARREQAQLRKILVTMGGIDNRNAAGSVLKVLATSSLPDDCHVTIILGRNTPRAEEVRAQSDRLSCKTDFLQNVDNMAELMTESDLCIGAAGATAWERACLGLPTIMVVLAENQTQVARSLQEAGAAMVIPDVEKIAERLPDALLSISDPDMLSEMSRASSCITDGLGAERACKALENTANAS